MERRWREGTVVVCFDEEAVGQLPMTDKVDSASGPQTDRDVAVLAWIRTRGWGLARWLVLLLIASLAIPALTKQWNDRTQELQVKESLLTDASKASAAAVYGAVSASFQKGEPQKATRGRLDNIWQRDRAALDSRFRVYFGGSKAADHWFGEGSFAVDEPGLRDTLAFRETLRRYVLLACCDRGMRDRRIERLQEYVAVAVPPNVDVERPVWSTLMCGPQEGCDMDSTYRKNYRRLGDLLLNQRQILMNQLLAANGKGFSSGWRDFIADLNPLG